MNKGTYQVLTSEICEKGEIGMPPTLNCQMLANTATKYKCIFCACLYCLCFIFLLGPLVFCLYFCVSVVSPSACHALARTVTIAPLIVESQSTPNDV